MTSLYCSIQIFSCSVFAGVGRRQVEDDFQFVQRQQRIAVGRRQHLDPDIGHQRASSWNCSNRLRSSSGGASLWSDRIGVRGIGFAIDLPADDRRRGRARQAARTQGAWLATFAALALRPRLAGLAGRRDQLPALAWAGAGLVAARDEARAAERDDVEPPIDRRLVEGAAHVRHRGIDTLGGDADPIVVRRRAGGVTARLPSAAQGEDDVALVMDRALDECFRRAQPSRRASRTRLAGKRPFRPARHDHLVRLAHLALLEDLAGPRARPAQAHLAGRIRQPCQARRRSPCSPCAPRSPGGPAGPANPGSPCGPAGPADLARLAGRVRQPRRAHRARRECPFRPARHDHLVHLAHRALLAGPRPRPNLARHRSPAGPGSPCGPRSPAAPRSPGTPRSPGSPRSPFSP